MRILIVFGLTVFGMWTVSAAADDAFVDTLRDCRSLASAEERLTCYDGAVDRHTARDDAEVADPTAPAATEATEEPSAEDLFGMSPVEAQRALEESAGRKTVDRIEASVVELRTIASNKVAVVLDNGQVWRQTTASSLRLSEGDDIVIRRRSFGSHTLQKAGAARSMKVQRVR